MFSELVDNKGRQFDAQVVDAMVELLESGEIDFDDLEVRWMF